MLHRPETSQLLRQAQHCLAQNSAAVLVTVWSTRGSAPRETGAAMLVMGNAVAGTVGGGHLEWVAIERARQVLIDGLQALPMLVEYPLGATLGQCCGGAMTLRYECLSAQHLQGLQSQVGAYKTLFLFGAGHVAQALVPLLAGLPLCIVWADSRDAINIHQTPFSSGLNDSTELPTHVTTVISDTLEAELSAAQAGDMALIMTHSHSLDESLVQAALAQPQLAYIGLIGSATKRRLFEQRLTQRGFTADQLAQVTCPIGIAGAVNHHSKLPAVIAIQVAAQLLTYL